MPEIAKLRRAVGEVEARMSREPVYANVVKDLPEKKMVRVIVTMGCGELPQTVGTNSDTANRMASRILL